MTKFLLATLVLAIFSVSRQASAATLSFNEPSRSVQFTTQELLKRKDIESFQPKNDPSYPHDKITYQAIPFAKLVDQLHLKPNATIKFKCADGFSASLSTEELLNTDPKKSQALIAIEDPKKPWPKLKKTSPLTAGPFYLIWKNPALSHISPEGWPYQVVAFEIAASLAEQYPLIVPDPHADASVTRGFQIFTKNCFTCHTLNKQGDAKMGPDLNVPYNPTEYFAKGYLEKWIRDPQSLHVYPQSKMSAFPESILSKEELTDLLDYLKHMASHKTE